ncbi:hypothetical protein GGR55DRAFT_698486 [Xylaria sp. FL0064]|nr:hypothetical protein GGR55DRAFT_698486 [Xylaria sp. FL0064]
MENSENENLRASFASYYPPQRLSQPQPPQLSHPPQAHQLPTCHPQLSAAQQSQSTPPRQYTTVGSVYNPQPQPLQPPVRRGRTVKSLFPYKSDSPAGQLHYTPLQQNSERAVSPVRFDTDPLPSTVNISRQQRHVLQKFGVAVPSAHSTSNAPVSLQSPTSDNSNAARYFGNRAVDFIADHHLAANNSTMFASASADSDNGSDGADTKPISAMNFNSLTNLASYPNPMQRAAQKLLASHRPNPVPDPGSQASDSHSNPYNAEPEPLFSLSEAPMSFRGAPAPLTAGPPGVRQLRPTTFEHETLQRAREFDDENPMMNPYIHIPLGQHIGGPSFETESNSSALAVEEFEEDDVDDGNGNYRNKEKNPIVDTLTAYEASLYFPNSLPLSFNPQTQPISPHWVSERLEKLKLSSDLCRAKNPEKFAAERKRAVDNHFYSGVNKFNKAFDMAVLEHNHRSVAHAVGRPFKEPQNHEGKVVNRQLQVREASLMPTSEHAAPLLSMALQAIISRPEISPFTKLPRFKCTLYPAYAREFSEHMSRGF